MKYKITLHGEELVLTALADGKMPLRAGGFLHFDPKSVNDLYLLVQDGKILIWHEERRVFAPKGQGAKGEP